MVRVRFVGWLLLASGCASDPGAVKAPIAAQQIRPFPKPAQSEPAQVNDAARCADVGSPFQTAEFMILPGCPCDGHLQLDVCYGGSTLTCFEQIWRQLEDGRCGAPGGDGPVRCDPHAEQPCPCEGPERCVV